MGTALRVAVAVVVVAAVVVALAWVFQRRLIYLPFGAPGAPASAYLSGGRDVVLRTEDGLELTAWWAPATGPARDRTVLVAPGNGGSRVLRVPLVRALAAEGFDVLLVDYRGYGGNPGSPSEEGLAADVAAAYRHLVEDRGVPPERIVLFGESLGGAPLTRLATERPVGALVLRSPFTSLADVGARAYPFLPVRALLRDRFPLLEQVRSVRAPVAVVAGGADEIVPVEQSRAVADAAGAAYVEVSGAGHNDEELTSGPVVVDTVVRVVGG
ncbi:MAG TPA: alpha/beta fold hydrolase [Pseudonocardia sp.]|uniref:alpha/beta hydrolase n=1 Tax=Pseudonocardia sp. TaxID=60912 RepID=UPI002B4B5806|nr:alpha/beta fold hydrolase [Pseudonocardia sp.]HLU57761.1 alpha/beta fold hydrolase [Pseudonocardia sp.]